MIYQYQQKYGFCLLQNDYEKIVHNLQGLVPYIPSLKFRVTASVTKMAINRFFTHITLQTTAARMNAAPLSPAPLWAAHTFPYLEFY
jgi:hypothetical protein